MAPASKKVIVITGPTASGKTDLAIQVAQELRGTPPFRRAGVISADSRQVYCSMNIGTAKPEFAWSSESHQETIADTFLTSPQPSPQVRRGSLPHYLFNIRRPNQPLSLSEWQTAAFSVINRIHKVGMPAVLAGGTMLYIDSIVKNFEVPNVEANVEFRDKKEQESAEDLYKELLTHDPAAKDFIEPQNKRRIIRALEVMAATNRTFSELRRQRPSPYKITMIGLFDGWEALEARITQRVQQMLVDGLLEETQSLVDIYGADLPLLKTMNYKQALGIIQGTLLEQEALGDMRRANIRYARRQMSWWKNRNEITWLKKPEASAVLQLLE